MSVLRRNNVTVSGLGSKAMLLAHGYGCDQNMWRFITPAFATDYKIVLIDLVGSGSSDLSAYDRRSMQHSMVTPPTSSKSAMSWR